MNNGKAIIIGISDENINRLRKNQPIQFNLNEKGFDIDLTVFIVTGKDEVSIAENIADHFIKK